MRNSRRGNKRFVTFVLFSDALLISLNNSWKNHQFAAADVIQVSCLMLENRFRASALQVLDRHILRPHVGQSGICSASTALKPVTM